MAKKNICEIHLDRKSAKEGEYVTVTWNCESPDAVTMTVDNGFSSTNTQLPDSGSRSMLVEKSKKETTFRLNAVFNGKVERKEVKLKVDNFNPKKASKNSSAHNNKAPFSGVKSWFSGIPMRWNAFWQRVKYGWQAMPEKKRKIWKIAFAVMIAMWLISIGQRSGYKAGYEKGMQQQTTEQTLYRG